MIQRKIDGLPRCKKCNSDNVVLQRNASKAFQVKCNDCGNKTIWEKKLNAVLDWVNQ